MAKAVIGQPFTFTVLFLDASGNPVVPPDPTIYAFYFVAGIQQVLIPAATPMTAVPGNVGRYIYSTTIPSHLSDNITVYGMMSGTDPTTLLVISVEQEVDLFASPNGGGLRVSFVRPGAC